MVDRFNNPGAQPRHTPFDDPAYDGYQGGTFAGVQAQLEYVKRLGAGAIWLSPVLENLPFDKHSYHGYGIHDFVSAERYFATDPANADDELRALVDAAHATGLHVIFDIVLNHAGDVFAYSPQGAVMAAFSPTPMPVYWRNAEGTARTDPTPVEDLATPSRGELVWPAELQRNAFFRRQGGQQAGGDDTVGDFDSLKQIRTDDPDLQNLLIRAYQYVIARFDVDGFRIDTLRYCRGDLARIFGNAMREFAESIGKTNFFTFGEVLDSTDEVDIARFIGRNTTDPTRPQFVGVDAALDYPLFNTLKPVVKAFAAPSAVIDMYNVRRSIERDVLSSHGDATRYFVTFLDNHDMKERIRYVDPADPPHFDDQVTLGVACLCALPGIPCLYYGTEQGLHGAGNDDAAVREALWGSPAGFDESSTLYVAVRRIAAVRDAAPALRYGRMYFRQVAGDGQHFDVSRFRGGVLAWSRILSDEEVTVVANTSTTATIDIDVIVDASVTAAGGTCPLLYSNKPSPAAPGAVRDVPGATVVQADGSLQVGTARVVHVSLEPMEVQILGA